MVAIKDQLLKLSKHEILEQLTQHEIVPFLNEKSLYALTWTCKHYRNKYKDIHADKKVAAEMLHCVLNPTEHNQTRFHELLSIPKQDLNGPPLYLIQNNGEEIYFNKAGMRKTKRKLFGINVLEAILRTHNFHLARPLFKSIPDKEKTEALKKYIKKIKAKGIWGIPELLTACNNILARFEELFDAKNWKELERLSRLIGQAQKEGLPWFSLYLFCNQVSHANADYTKPPSWSCFLGDFKKLDLDLVGYESSCILHKSISENKNSEAIGVDVSPIIVESRPPTTNRIRESFPRIMANDLQAFEKQSAVLSAVMDETIEQYELDYSEPTATAGVVPRKFGIKTSPGAFDGIWHG